LGRECNRLDECPIIARALELLSTPASLEKMRAELKALIAPMVKPGAANNTALELAKILALRKPPLLTDRTHSHDEPPPADRISSAEVPVASGVGT